MAPKVPKQRKIAVMGYRSVGKSSLSIRFVEDDFSDCYNPTIENTFTKSTRVNSQDYRLEVIDTAGQDEYSLFPSLYSIDVHGYVLVYSITSAASFETVKLIYEKLQDLTGKVQHHHQGGNSGGTTCVPVILVGNKTDLQTEREIPVEEGRKLASEWNATFVEASAKQNVSVSDIFHTLLTEIKKADTKIDYNEKGSCTIS